MKTATPAAPGVVLGAYPERRTRPGDWMARIDARLQSALSSPFSSMARYRRFADRVRAFEPNVGVVEDGARAERLRTLRAMLARDGFQEPLVAEAFAHVARACETTMGLRPFDTQLMAARIMLDGRLAEMATGEGKTLTAAFSAATAALAGIPVHVITVNDYLVTRDAERLRPLYEALGLTVGAVTQQLSATQRRGAYACDVTYCTAKELAFDYLRDGVALGHCRDDLALRVRSICGEERRDTLLRGLCMAIIDEADSVLIDEARVPLILSQACGNVGQRDYYAHALRLASGMQVGRDYTLDTQQMSGALTAAGSDLLERRSTGLSHVWRNRPHREETVATALAALHLYDRDRHYLVHEGKVLIIDQSTGRVAPGRIWSRGLHQLIELKERCEPSGETVTAAQITFQRFFQRYLRLGGMSGTLDEARSELRAVYNLGVTRVPLRRPCQRKVLPTTLYRDRHDQFAAVIARVAATIHAGRPVLVGTDSVEESEALSARLTAAAIPHEVLNARQDAREAEIVARAGHARAVTVATNMAGRGTDIPLGPGVAERGGLHLISCQHNASRRIDRQLLGRCARQGDPGTAETLLSLDRPRISRFFPAWATRRITAAGMTRPGLLTALAVRAPQWLEERAQRTQRAALLKQDERLDATRTLGAAAE